MYVEIGINLVMHICNIHVHGGRLLIIKTYQNDNEYTTDLSVMVLNSFSLGCIAADI